MTCGECRIGQRDIEPPSEIDEVRLTIIKCPFDRVYMYPDEDCCHANERTAAKRGEKAQEKQTGKMAQSIIFAEAAGKACLTADRLYTFICPLCGGKAAAQMSSKNGHVGGTCQNCRVSFRE